MQVYGIGDAWVLPPEEIGKIVWAGGSIFVGGAVNLAQGIVITENEEGDFVIERGTLHGVRVFEPEVRIRAPELHIMIDYSAGQTIV